MVNITNEAWFGESAAPYLFLAYNVFRAVENRVTLVRAANTGVSCFIDPFGRVIGRVSEKGRDIFIDGYLAREIPLRTETTFYTGFGDVFSGLNLGLSLFLLLFSLRVYYLNRKGYILNEYGALHADY